MNGLTPADVLAQVSAALPEHCRKHIIVIGSLAAGYSFFAGDSTKAVRTKDVDCILEPFEAAVATGEAIARALIDAGWQRRLAGEHTVPGTPATPDRDLPAVRLYPPSADMKSADAWFIELLTVPESEHQSERKWTRITLREGDFALPSLRYLSVVSYRALPVQSLGIRYARPELMALANLLEHPSIKLETIKSELPVDRRIKRSNKDLGRVLAIAVLADVDDFRPWIAHWLPALQHCFPSQWTSIAAKLGDGLRELLRSEGDFDQAYDTCINGLLSSVSTTREQLRIAAQRLIADAIEPVEQVARASTEPSKARQGNDDY